MTEQTISAAVFTREKDQSYLPTGISEIGAAFVGPTVKGEAFVPTQVTSYPDFVEKFGAADGNSYLPYSVETYLTDAGSATITRILGTEGYTHPAIAGLVLSGSAGYTLVGAIHHSNKNYTGDYSSTVVSGYNSASNANFYLSGSNTDIQNVTASFVSTDPNYIGKIFGTTPVTTTNNGYLYSYYQNSADALIAASPSSSLLIVSSSALDFANVSCSYAVTPMIQSQPVNGVSLPLFEIFTLSQGEYNNTEIKISVYNIRKAEEIVGYDYGLFNIAIRSINDTDKNPNVLQTFTDMNLDPSSDNYICKIIGDKYNEYVYDSVTGGGQIVERGNYKNRSKYIRIKVTDDVENAAISPTLIPFGFAALTQPFAIGAYYMPSASMVTTQSFYATPTIYNSKVYYGYNFDFVHTDNKEYLKPIANPSTPITGSNLPFTLYGLTVNASAPVGAGVLLETTGALSTARKFSVPFQGGFGGMDPAISKNMGLNIGLNNNTNTMGFDLSATGSGSAAYIKALDILSNTDLYDYNLLFTPGVVHALHPTVTNYAMDMCDNRGDVFYVFDANKMDLTNSNDIVTTIEDVDTSYSGTYTPWLKIADTVSNKQIIVPPSTMMAGVFAYSDRVGQEWYAPAGFNRGIMKNVLDVYLPITVPNRNILAAGRVNAIAKFPKEGIVVMAQKTLQLKQSALSNVNVRRLLIKVKKYIASTSKYLLFENNTDKTRAQFINMVTPYLDNIQEKQGIYLFKVVCDETNNTPDLIDRNILYGQIWLQPAQAIEVIIIDFNVTNTNATFSV
jgi:hypothetical protein